MTDARRGWLAVTLLCLALLVSMDGVLGGGSPCPGTGFHMAIFEDRSKREDLPPEQADAIQSSRIDELVLEAGGTKYLIHYLQDVSDKDDDWLNRAKELPRDSLPWVVIDMDGVGESVPMQEDLESHEAFVKRYLDKGK